MRYILLFIAIFTFSCKYNITSPVGTIKDYTAGSGKIYYVSSSSSVAEIEDALRKNKHSLGKYKIAVTNSGNSDDILSNIAVVLTNNISIFSNVELDISKLTNEEIKEGAFSNAKNLRSVMLSDKVTNIGKNAFSGCYSLNSIRFPKNLQEIGESAFSSCSSLTLIILDSEQSMTISKDAFSGCSSLVNLILPAGLTNIDNSAFSNCSKLANVEYLGKTNSLSNCSPFSSSSYPTNLYLPEVEESGKTNFTNFLGKTWSNDNIHTKKHIPYNK